MQSASLRLRLFVLILSPLVLMAMLLGYWRYSVAQNTAENLFDRSLLAAALAISRDVAISSGDALLPSTSDLIRDASGGAVFYHVTGPGGIYVTGYAYPPAVVRDKNANLYAPHLYEAIYRGDAVRVLQVTERVTIGNLTGDTTVTAWQRLSDRDAFAAQLAVRAAGLIGALLATLALVVWFGVALGLRPLIDLQDAISIRSPDDLSRIRRPVPDEVQGIVKTLNQLFGQLETSRDAQQVFISDAAHQLRNPAAAVQAMAEALRDAKTDQDRNQRIGELITAARNSARVANQLLSLDRLQQPGPNAAPEVFDLNVVLHDVCSEAGPVVLSQGVEFELCAPDHPVQVSGDQVFVAEAVKNLIDNAMKHGGAKLSSIWVQLDVTGTTAEITVRDDGQGLRPDQSDAAFSRFSQVEPSDGSGLGLAIARTVAERHGGSLVINTVDKGASLTLTLPYSP